MVWEVEGEFKVVEVVEAKEAINRGFVWKVGDDGGSVVEVMPKEFCFGNGDLSCGNKTRSGSYF